jgi:acetamidase/formamidase
MSAWRSHSFFYTFAPHPVARVVASGERVTVECPDSDNCFADRSVIPEIQQVKCAGSEVFPGNPMAGPVAIEGASQGDVLAVSIHAIHLTATHGQSLIKPGHGLLAEHELTAGQPDLRVPTHMYRWEVSAPKGVAKLLNPLGSDEIIVPLDPFVGCIGVCPKWGQSISTLHAGEHGGNMDISLIKPGATLYLPVFAEGALLGLGDLHAAQGHGEILGGAIETAGEVELSVRVIKKRSIPVPLLRNATTLAAIASEGDLRASVRSAYANLVRWLDEGFKLNRFDAYNLVSQRASIAMGNIVGATPSVAAYLPIDALPERSLHRETELT